MAHVMVPTTSAPAQPTHSHSSPSAAPNDSSDDDDEEYDVGADNGHESSDPDFELGQSGSGRASTHHRASASARAGSKATTSGRGDAAAARGVASGGAAKTASGRRRRIRNAKQQELNRLAQQRYRERKKQVGAAVCRVSNAQHVFALNSHLTCRLHPSL